MGAIAAVSAIVDIAVGIAESGPIRGAYQAWSSFGSSVRRRPVPVRVSADSKGCDQISSETGRTAYSTVARITSCAAAII